MMMKKLDPMSLATIAVVALTLLLSLLSYAAARNTGNASEQAIAAIYENNEQVLAQYGQKLQEAAQVPAMAREDLRSVFRDAMAGRYGADGGAGAIIKVVQEQNPNLDQSMYVQIQRIVEAGRDDFRMEQQRLVDAKRTYRTALGSFWVGSWLSVAGYPTIRVGYPIGQPDDYPAISTRYARGSFDSGLEEGPITLRPAQ